MSLQYFIKRWYRFFVLAVSLQFLLSGCLKEAPTLDISTLNATRYPAVAVSQETVDAMKQARLNATPGPTPTRSSLDMIADEPAEFALASGQYQFVEFFRYG